MGVFLIIVTVISILLGVIWIIYGISLVAEYGLPPKDSDVLEMLEKYKSEYNRINTNWDNCYYIEAKINSKVRTIWKTKVGILIPYYIINVGVIPVWYKSAGQIDAMFKELKKGSEFENKKRKKLGLE